MPNKKPERVKSFCVEHPKHNGVMVLLTDPPKRDEVPLAIMAAAHQWQVPWTKIHSDCAVQFVSEQYRCKCGKCRKQFFADNPAERCPICVKTMKNDLSRFMRNRYVDRRVNANINN